MPLKADLSHITLDFCLYSALREGGWLVCVIIHYTHYTCVTLTTPPTLNTTEEGGGLGPGAGGIRK